MLVYVLFPKQNISDKIAISNNGFITLLFQFTNWNTWTTDVNHIYRNKTKVYQVSLIVEIAKQSILPLLKL